VSFYKQQNSKTKVLEVCTVAGWSLVGVAVLLWRRRAGTEEWTVWSEDPLRCTGRDSSPSWSTFGRGGIASLGTKELVGAIALPHSLA